MIAELQALDMETMTGADATRLWDHIKTQDICFDDITRGRGDMFAERLIRPTTVALEYKKGALVLVENIVPGLQADIHWFMWNEIHDRELVGVGKDLCNDLFVKFNLNRISTYIPAMNKRASGIARRVGFKYEGTMRQLFLYKGSYQDVDIWGLLKHEFQTLGGRG